MANAQMGLHRLPALLAECLAEQAVTGEFSLRRAQDCQHQVISNLNPSEPGMQPKC
jgi:hypothetical protein